MTAIAVCVVTFPAAGGPAYHGWLPAFAVASALLVFGLQAESPLRRALSTPPLVWLGGISYEIFLVHVLLMFIAMGSVLRWPIFTGSVAGLFVVTLALAIPLAWVLRRVTSDAGFAGSELIRRQDSDESGDSARPCALSRNGTELQRFCLPSQAKPQ